MLKEKLKKVKKLFFVFALFIVSYGSLHAQIDIAKLEGKKVQVACVAFYNLENLFDTIVDPDTTKILREDFTPLGKKNWNTEKYYKKLDNLARVISQIGTELSPNGPAVMGVAEVENATVLNDLVNRPMLLKRHYKFIHFDSPDERGIDVALLYQPDRFEVKKAWVRHENSLPHHDKTRDMLAVYGLLDGEPFYFIVDHWPSRRGGQKRSEPLRDTVAKHDRMVIDSIMKADPDAKIVYMGDLNDDPVDDAVKIYMKSNGKIKKLKDDELYNPMEEKYKKGIGTLAYNDAWDLFDQFMITQNLLSKHLDKSYKFAGAHIFNKKWMIQQSGHFAGYPLRTYVGDQFMNGYSDHFPVYMYFVREKNK